MQTRLQLFYECLALSPALLMAVTTSWHTEEDVYRAPPIDRSILPTAPRAAREPNIDRSRLPRCPPYTAFLGNLPYDVTEDSIKNFFNGLNVSCFIFLVFIFGFFLVQTEIGSVSCFQVNVSLLVFLLHCTWNRLKHVYVHFHFIPMIVFPLYFRSFAFLSPETAANMIFPG